MFKELLTLDSLSLSCLSIIVVKLLALIGTASLSEVNFKTRVNDLMKPLTDSLISLMLLLNGHNSLNFSLTLIDCTLHICVTGAHLAN